MRRVLGEVGKELASGVAGLLSGVQSQTFGPRPTPSPRELINRVLENQPVTSDQESLVQSVVTLKDTLQEVPDRATRAVHRTVAATGRTTRQAARKARRTANSAVRAVAVPLEAVDRKLHPVRQYVALTMLLLVLAAHAAFVLAWAGLARLTPADAIRCVVGVVAALAAAWVSDRYFRHREYYVRRPGLRVANTAVTACVAVLITAWASTAGLAWAVAEWAVTLTVVGVVSLAATWPKLKAAAEWVREKPERAAAARQLATAVVLMVSGVVLLTGIVSVLRSTGIGWVAVLFVLPLAWKMLSRHV